MTSASLQVEVLTDSPKVYFPCQESVDGSTLTDVSGNNRHATKVGSGAVLGSTSILPMGGFAAENTNQGRFSFPNDTTLNPTTGNFAIEMWFSHTAGGPNAYPLSSPYDAYVWVTGSLVFQFDCLNNQVVGPVIPRDGRTHHMVAQRVGALAELWIDNVRVGTASVTGDLTTGMSPDPFELFGSAVDGVATRFIGKISHLAYYSDHALTAARIATHYYHGAETPVGSSIQINILIRFIANDTDQALIGAVLVDYPDFYWPCQEDTDGITLTDASGNGYVPTKVGTMVRGAPAIMPTGGYSTAHTGIDLTSAWFMGYDPDLDQAAVGSDYCWEFWIKATKVSANWTYVFHRGVTGGVGLNLESNSSGKPVPTPADFGIKGTIDIQTGVLFYIVLQRVANVGQIWINGVLNRTWAVSPSYYDTNNPATAPRDIEFFRNRGFADSLKGSMAHIAYYKNRSLPQARILAHYQTGKPIGIRVGVIIGFSVNGFAMSVGTPIIFGVVIDFVITTAQETELYFDVYVGFSIAPIVSTEAVAIDEVPAYGVQEPQLANPESPPPEFGIDPLPTERWYPDDQYRT